MTNHYRVLVETPDANLSRGMRQLNGAVIAELREGRRLGFDVPDTDNSLPGLCLNEPKHRLASWFALDPVVVRLKRSGIWLSNVGRERILDLAGE